MVHIKLMLKKGFTLVELLIVIGLLGAIALIVIAAINPIEQANRARDTRLKGDGSQLVSAVERYFAAKSDFPWVVEGTATNNDEAFGFANASAASVGICGDASCGTDGELITSLELKTEFRNRDFIKNATDDFQSLFVGKAIGSSSSVYACFVPTSKSNRDKACADDQVYTLDTTNGTRAAQACDATSTWPTSGTPWVVCVPE